VSTINIGGRLIGTGHPAYIIAEACDNHMGDLDAAIEMARQAKLAGADAVKYQHHLPDEEMLPNTPMSDNFDEPLYVFLKKHALSRHSAWRRRVNWTRLVFLRTRSGPGK
jgi:N-acetylneuraminate synthase